MQYDYYKKIAILDIHTWVGTSAFGASHYYGRIHFNKKSIDVERKIETKKLADKLNSEDDYLSYKVGDTTGRFHDVRELIKQAKQTYYDRYAIKAIALVEGSSSTLDPQKVLCASPKIKRKALNLYNEFEKYNGWGCNEDDEPLVEDICDDWDKLWTDYSKEIKK